MDKRLLTINFPECGVTTLYVNDKNYTREEFYKAQQLELRRDKSGRFVSKVITIYKTCPLSRIKKPIP
tara:strand:- start:213 stop:416 length:204 start_codon:yes stop_codon:yes gene_type:complete